MVHLEQRQIVLMYGKPLVGRHLTIIKQHFTRIFRPPEG